MANPNDTTNLSRRTVLKGSAGIAVAASVGMAATNAQAATVRSMFRPLPVATVMEHSRFMFDASDLTEVERADPVIAIALRYQNAINHYYACEGDDGESDDMRISDQVWALTPQSLAAQAVRLAVVRWDILVQDACRGQDGKFGVPSFPDGLIDQALCEQIAFLGRLDADGGVS